MKRFDNTQAYREGWGLFTVDSGKHQIQRLDDPKSVDESYPEEPIFESDDAAFKYVVAKAAAGSQYHQIALDFVPWAKK